MNVRGRYSNPVLKPAPGLYFFKLTDKEIFQTIDTSKKLGYSFAPKVKISFEFLRALKI